MGKKNGGRTKKKPNKHNGDHWNIVRWGAFDKKWKNFKKNARG